MTIHRMYFLGCTGASMNDHVAIRCCFMLFVCLVITLAHHIFAFSSMLINLMLVFSCSDVPFSIISLCLRCSPDNEIHVATRFSVAASAVSCLLRSCIVALTVGLTHRRWLSGHVPVCFSRCSELGRCLCDLSGTFRHHVTLFVAPTAFSPNVSGEQPTYTYTYLNTT